MWGRKSTKFYPSGGGTGILSMIFVTVFIILVISCQGKADGSTKDITIVR
jgi:hypothetical protein